MPVTPVHVGVVQGNDAAAARLGFEDQAARKGHERVLVLAPAVPVEPLPEPDELADLARYGYEPDELDLGVVKVGVGHASRVALRRLLPRGSGAEMGTAN